MEVFGILCIILFLALLFLAAIGYRNKDSNNQKEKESRRKKLYEMLDHHIDSDVPQYLYTFAKQVDVDVDLYMANLRKRKQSANIKTAAELECESNVAKSPNSQNNVEPPDEELHRF